MDRKIYFIRHAPTEANVSGEMVKDYDSYDIIKPLDDKTWHEKVGIHIRNMGKDDYDEDDIISARNYYIYCSPTTRCISTARYLFPHPNKADNQWIYQSDGLKEIDCSGLGDLKFWELSKEEFDARVHPDLDTFDKNLTKYLKELADECFQYGHDLICVTHGMYVRYLYNKLTGKGDKTLYDLINSKTFQFYNLDMMECTVDENLNISVSNIYRFKE